jgi:hypothetical protein
LAPSREGADDLEGGGLADVVGVGLEGEAPHAEGLAADAALAEVARSLRTRTSFWASLMRSALATISREWPCSRAVVESARMSLGKQEPP